MSKLIVRKLKCIEETDEIGSDDVYLAIFRGSFSLPPTINVTGGKNTAWGDMTTGKVVNKDMLLEDPYHSENVYVAALIEQDSGKDLTGAAWAQAAEFWANNWMNFGGNAGAETVALFALLFHGGLDNDELLGVKRIPPIFVNGGIGVQLDFTGDGGKYELWFVKRP